ncbi:MAG: hypothetical protein WC497_03800 [Patescibacteria group bacterium]
MKKLMLVLMVAVVTFALVQPALAEIKDSQVAPPPADSAKAAVTPAPAAPARPTLSDKNPIDSYLAADGWHIRIFVSFPKAIEWSGQTPVPGPYTVGLSGLLCVETDPTVANVGNGSQAVEFVIPLKECKCQDEGCYLWCRPSADGVTAWPWTWNHPSRAKNDKGQQFGGYRPIWNADGTWTWVGKQ